jgi:hypothetical protein
MLSVLVPVFTAELLDFLSGANLLLLLSLSYSSFQILGD